MLCGPPGIVEREQPPGIGDRCLLPFEQQRGVGDARLGSGAGPLDGYGDGNMLRGGGCGGLRGESRRQRARDGRCDARN